MIVTLRDRPDLIPVVARWSFTQWSHVMGTLAQITARVAGAGAAMRLSIDRGLAGPGFAASGVVRS
jgi:hypothetical protein